MIGNERFKEMRDVTSDERTIRDERGDNRRMM